MHRPGLLLPFLLLAARAPTQAPAAAPLRFDAARFTPPAGWQSHEEQGLLVLEPPDHSVRVEVGRSAKMSGDMEDYGADLIAAAGKLPGYTLLVEPASGTHRHSKGRWHHFVYQCQDRGYVAALTVGAGGRAQTFSLVTATTDGYEKTREAVGAMVDGVVLSCAERLERGHPPLTRYEMDATVDFLEWLVHTPLTADQRSTIEAEVRHSWREKDQEEIDGVAQVLEARDQLAAMKPAERELARQAVLNDALASWRKDEHSPSARMMLAIHAAANEPIDHGEPPLTRQDLAAFAEYLLFAAGRTIDYEAKASKEAVDALVDEVVANHAGLTRAQRELIAGMPMLWAAVRVAWPDLPEPERHHYVEAWRQDASIQTIAKALAAVRDQEAARRAAATAHDTAADYARLQAQQMQFQAMQNVMRMQADTMRIMASNLGGNTQYVYRW